MRICPVPGCTHSYGNRKDDEKAYLRDFDSHDCERELHEQGHMQHYERPELPKINIDNKPTPGEMSKMVTESAEFANWKTYIDRQTAQHASTSELRRLQKESKAAKPDYFAPIIKAKASPRQGFKRTNRPQ